MGQRLAPLAACGLNQLASNKVSRCLHHICGRLLVSVSGRVVLRADNQTTALLSATVNRLDDVDELLFILENEGEFVIVSSAQIAHDMFVALHVQNSSITFYPTMHSC